MRAIPQLAVLSLLLAAAFGQQLTVTAHVQVLREHGDSHDYDASNVVVWLVPLSPALKTAATPQAKYRLVQRDKRFRPHVLVVTTGSFVEFPNEDPFFHNVFSLFNGQRFDLGLYEAGSSRKVRFDREGVSYIFCNIHPEMSAIVLALRTPFFATSNASGNLVIPDVPAGAYEVHAWYEKANEAKLNAATHEVNLTVASHSLGNIRVFEVPGFTGEHLNKFGDPYPPPPPEPPY